MIPKDAAQFREILALITYRHFEFTVGEDDKRCYLQVKFIANGAWQYGRKWLLSPHMTKTEVVQTALKAVLTAEEHEAREAFRYRGQPVFGPHYDIDALHWICEREGAHTDARKEAAE